MKHLTIDQAIEHLHWMAKNLEDMQKKYPDAKYRGVQLSLNGEELKEAKRDGDGVGYWNINGQELWIDLHFTTEPEDED